MKKNIIQASHYTAINYVLHSQNNDRLSNFVESCPTKNLTVTPYRQMYPGVKLERTNLAAPCLSSIEKASIMKQAAKHEIAIIFTESLSWKTCLSPWVQVNISHNLQVTPCCIHQHPAFFNMGQLSSQTSLMDVWHSEVYKRLRSSLAGGKPFIQCQTCGNDRPKEEL